jgi:tetratricopeptide (TPR) repeat protein
MLRVLISLLLLLSLSMAAGCSGPGSVKEHRAAGKEAFFNQDYAKARQHFLEALTAKPSDKELLHFIALCYRRDFMYDSAYFYLKQSDLLHPNDRETNLQIREVAIELAEWDGAISAVNVLANTGDGFEKHYTQLSDLWARANSPINAMFWARKALDSSPNSPELYLWTAYLAGLCDSLDVALVVLDSAIMIFDSTDAFVANKATILGRKKEYVAAERLLRPVAEKYPEAPEYQFDLAVILSEQDDREKKQEALQLLRELEPQAPSQLRVDSMIAELEKSLQ